MKWLITTSITLACLALTPETTAQEEPPHIGEFRNFFHPLTNSEWTYHTHRTDPDGTTQFEGTDLRTFRFGVRGRFVIEDVYNESEDGERVHIGIQIVGIDVETGQISISQFWPWQATMLGDTSARIDDGNDGQRRMVGIARPAGQSHPTFNFECTFQNEDLVRCVTDTEVEDGSRFRSNVETFSRR